MTPLPNESSFRVFARAFSNSKDGHEVGQFNDYQEALTAAAVRVRDDLLVLTNAGQSARELFDVWKVRGSDVTIVPDDAQRPFSATDFVRLMALQITGDDSRPLLLEVTCTDKLNFASGYSSPPKQWIFWVKAPATYTNATHLIQRATEYLYEEMSRPALESEGSSYTLLELTVRELTESQAKEVVDDRANKTVYVIQNDGSFAQFTP